jgi:hypothetical protein
MLSSQSLAFPMARQRLVLLVMFILTVCSGCEQSPTETYSIDEAWALSRTRSAEMVDQLQFSFRLDPANVSIGKDIFFVATLTNTTDLPIVFREPRQNGVLEIEYYDKTLLFSVEPVDKRLSIAYPAETGLVDMIPERIARDAFLTLPPHSSREIRLQLPHMVRIKDASATVFSEEYFPLPIGRYRVQMTYYNDVIGDEMQLGRDRRYVDLKAWVGKIEGEPAVLTITPSK